MRPQGIPSYFRFPTTPQDDVCGRGQQIPTGWRTFQYYLGTADPYYLANVGYWDYAEHVYAFVVGPSVGPRSNKDGALTAGSPLA